MTTRGAAQQRQSKQSRTTRPDSGSALPHRNVSLIESLEKRQMYAAQVGINVNDFAHNSYKQIVQMLVDSGTKDVRLWYGFDSYSVRETYKVATYARKFHHDGFNVTLSVNPRKGRHGTADETRGFFNWLAREPGMAEAVDLWEIGNEPDSQKYWRGTLGEYVTDYLAPASKVLHSLGEKVVSAGVSWNPKDIKELADNGMLKYVDYVGYHPYRNSTKQLRNAVAEIRTYIGDTPMVATEWNVRGHENDTDGGKAWASEAADYWSVVRENFAIAHYFCAVANDSMAGPAGVLTASGKHNNPFYGTYMNFQYAGQDNPGPGDGKDDDGGKDDGGKDNGGGKGDNGKDDDQGKDNDDKGKNNDGKDNDDKGKDDDNGKGNDDGKTPTKKPTKPSKPAKPSKPSSDSDSDASDGKSSGGSKGETPSKSPTKKPTKPSKPAKPSAPVEAPTPVVVVPAVPPVLGGLGLIDARRDRMIKPYAVLNGVVTIDLAYTGTPVLSLLASANKKVKSVQFTVNGDTYVDNVGGFTLYGETGSDINGATFYPGQTYYITAQGFTNDNATGTATEVTSLVINVIDSTGNPVLAAAAKAEADRLRAIKRARRDRFKPVPVLPGLE